MNTATKFKFLLGCNMKMSLTGGDKNLIGCGESNRENFPVEGMSKVLASGGRDSLPILSSRENCFTWHISHKA